MICRYFLILFSNCFNSNVERANGSNYQEICRLRFLFLIVLLFIYIVVDILYAEMSLSTWMNWSS